MSTSLCCACFVCLLMQTTCPYNSQPTSLQLTRLLRAAPDCLQDCGTEGKPCCYVSDATAEAERCTQGLTCIVSKVGYADQGMYYALVKNPEGLRSTDVMGVCK